MLNLEFVSKSTYNNHQGDYLFPTVHDSWHTEQQSLIDEVSGRDVWISGDGRCDSPGYSAKYCTYSVMDQKTDKILDIETIQVSEVTSSNAMEREGCKRVLDRLGKDFKVPVKVFCTDRHMSIQKMMREEYSSIDHQYDVWHLSKSVCKTLMQKAKKKESEELMGWIPAIKNHLWWSASTCHGDKQEMFEKWQSVTHHVTNQHDWGTGTYPSVPMMH